LFGAQVDGFLEAVEDLRGQRELSGLRAAMDRLLAEPGLRGRAAARLDQWEQLLEALAAQGLADFVRIDPGIVRGLAYYTGFVFEVFLIDESGAATGRALAGGGRFDHLIGLLGYPDTPAVGFGMGDVVLGEALAERGLLPEVMDAPDFVLVIGGERERTAALHLAAQLRLQGYRVSYPLKLIGFGKQFKAAGQSGARAALIFGSEEVAAGKVRLRDLRSGEEALLAGGDVLAAVAAFKEGVAVNALTGPQC
jgi:histidyl-tRNA synthetase